jgi:A nuclease family of the HNH/ENDO VII superfamily with conserved AHH
MLTFREMRRRFKLDGFHAHHVIPIKVIEKRAFASFFGQLRAAGFDPDDFGNNGMHLPCTEIQAAAFKLPLHRGPHPRYNEMVALRIAAFERLHVQDALHEVAMLQHSLKWGLRNATLHPRDPFSSKTDFRKLDAEVDLLWGSTRPTG